MPGAQQLRPFPATLYARRAVSATGLSPSSAGYEEASGGVSRGASERAG